MNIEKEFREVVISKVKQILETHNQNSTYQDAKLIWLQVFLPALKMQEEFWAEKYNAKTSSKRH